MKKNTLSSIEEAIKSIKKGEIIIVVDDENRENEGDFVAAAQAISPKMINFMATHGRGLICCPLTEKRCKKLKLDLIVNTTSDPMETAFTVSVDLRGKGVSKILMNSCISYAIKNNNREVFLISNSKLEAAKKLYLKFGFVEVTLDSKKYLRGDYKMILTL